MLEPRVATGADALKREAERQFSICNACRYCEGYCAVFPAMELLDLFTDGDVSYLANLCHDCRGCYQACMYSEPHDLAMNIPTLMTELRLTSWERYSRPSWLARAFQRGPLPLLGLTAVSIFVLFAAYELATSFGPLVMVHTGPGAFYDVVSHTAIVVPALLLSALVVAVAGGGLVRFWKDSGKPLSALFNPRLWSTVLTEAATLRWLRGGGRGCYFPSEETPSPVRRRLHHAVAYGFLATFLATVSAWVMETVAHREPPYPILTAPVILGTVGGIGIICGCLGLLALRTRGNRRQTTGRAFAMDTSFHLSLIAVAATGLLLLILRGSSYMGLLLLIHLGTIAVLFLTAPYGKFVHAVYRVGALLRRAEERNHHVDDQAARRHGGT